MCLTNEPANLILFPKPEGYYTEQYELLLRIFDGMNQMHVFHKFDPVPNNKTDTNNHGPFSFDNIGMNWDYPEASYERRKEIIEEHKNYQLGMLYFICHDPRVPKELQKAMDLTILHDKLACFRLNNVKTNALSSSISGRRALRNTKIGKDSLRVPHSIKAVGHLLSSLKRRVHSLGNKRIAKSRATLKIIKKRSSLGISKKKFRAS